ncbi:MAG TPA: alpha/beta fold hydrolase [Micromonospora sp.]
MTVDGPEHLVSDGAGEPPVLVCPGMADTVLTWPAVVDLLAGRHRVVRFDRPGLGHSAPLGRLPTLAGEADRIAAVIGRSRLRRPVLVAHSVAAWHAEAYARLHPDDVAGLVLVDPSVAQPAPGSWQVSGAASRQRSDVVGRWRQAGAARRRDLSAVVGRWDLSAVVGRWLAGNSAELARLIDVTGLARLVGPALWAAAVRSMAARPPSRRLRNEVGPVYGGGKLVVAALAEWLTYDAMRGDLVELRRRTAPPPVPVVVLTALGDLGSPAARARWRVAHDRLAHSFPHGRQEVLRDCRHLVQLDRPDAVAAAVEM